MSRKFLKHIPSILFLCTLFLATNQHTLYAGSSKIYPIYPKTGAKLNSSQIQFKWADKSKYGEYMYMLCFTDDILNGTRECELPTSQQYTAADIAEKSSYLYWFVAYQRRDEYLSNLSKYPTNPSFSFKLYSNIFVAGINRYVPSSIYSQIRGKTPGDFFRPNTQVRNPNGSITQICRNRWSFKTSKDTTIIWNNSVPKGSVLGASTVIPPSKDTMCHIKFVKEGNRKTAIKKFCSIYNLSNISSSKRNIDGNTSIQVVGKYPESLKVQIDEYNCIKKFYNPLSWFRCKEEFVRTVHTVHPLKIQLQILQNNQKIPTSTVITQNGTFSLTSYAVSRTNNLFSLQASISLKIPLYNISEEAVSNYPLNPVLLENRGSAKPFSFPFKKIIGVTQWHGHTAFQNPHTGIDFGSKLEDTLAVVNGTVVAKGYDTYYGTCNSGGNYLTIKHENGMHSVYFHLMESYVNIGDTVRKNQVIAKSGNSGKSECKDLAYHLHFETRKGRAQSTHDNPVKYIDVDWNTVSTLNTKNIPGRLSGDNPHPDK